MVTELKKIYIVASKDHREKILDFLQELGAVRIIDLKERAGEEKNVDLDYALAKIKFSIDFLANFKKEKKIKLKEKLNKTFSPKINLTQKELDKIISTTDWQKITQEVEEVEVILSEFSNKIKKLQEEKEKISPWKNLTVDLNELKKVKAISFLTGKINSLNWQKFLDSLTNKIKLYEVKKINEENKNIYCLIIFLKEVENEIKKVLDENDFEKIEIDLNTSPDKYFKKLEEEIKITELKLIETNKKIDYLLDFQDKLKIIFDWLSWQKEKEEAKQKISKTNFTLSIFAWIEAKMITPLREGLEKISPEFEIVEIPIKEGEEVPVLLKNKEFISDFEVVTNIYGAPKYNEPDPTPFLTPFFILFFAICLSDAGYGLVLVILSLAIIKFLDLPKNTKKFFRLFVWLGIMTFFVGALMGGWFGLELETLPDFLKPIKELLIRIRIIDPIKNPLQLLAISLILGIFQILTGLAVKMYWGIKNKDALNAILDNGPWIFLIGSLLIFIAVQTKFLPLSLNLAKYLVLTGAALVVLTQGRKQKNILLKIPVGVLSLYGLIGYLSDTLSYSRLLALGLATSIIAMVINLIAKIFSQTIPVIGFIIAILVLIGGHIFNIGINALGAFIHSARLQFVEFFPKFMEGGGVKFKPFKKEGKYTTLV